MKTRTWLYGQGQRAKAYGLSVEAGLSILLGTRRPAAWIENHFSAGWFDGRRAELTKEFLKKRAIESLKQGNVR